MTPEIDLTAKLKQYFGFDTFKGDQEAIIRNVLAGNDTFVLMPTGGGKSLCYQLPSLIMEGTAIVISPLIALMKNQVDVINGMSEEEGIAHYLNSSLNKAAIDLVKSNILAGKTKLLYVAPESLTKDEYVDFLKAVKISFYAIDEAHCISEWGHDFRPEYRKIRDKVDEIGKAPLIALTATATDKVRTDIKKSLGIVDAKEFKSSFNRPNLYYEVRQKPSSDDATNVQIVKFIRQNPGKSGIIYCLSRKKVEELAAVLCANNIKAAPYHAGLDSATRSQTQDDFLQEDIDVIVATIAFGMGIDKPDVRFVIHYDIPKSLEGYYQETGRAGRDGGEGKCIAFYRYKDLKKLEKFGEEYLKDNCGNCDNCLHPKSKQEAEDALVIVLNAIQKIKEDFRTDYVIDFVSGRATDDIVDHKHDQLEEFGSGEDMDPKIWNPVIRQALIAGYLKKDVENYGLLKLTAAGKKFMKSPHSFMIVLDNEFSDEDDEVTEGQGGALDPELFAMLKDLRKKVAKQRGIPAYAVFQESSLEQMATVYPISLEELQQVQGVGAGKARKFGKEFVELIKRHCQENEIERPEDLRVRTVAKRSAVKVKIIHDIDNQRALDDIAIAQGIDFEELLDEVEAIVYSGTKLNIDYFLEEVMDDDHVDDIYEYFSESETDDLDTAMEELGDEYSEEEVRLVRIKFLSEVAN